MANTSTRTLRLLSLLQTHRYWPGGELSERLGVSVRTLRRDIDRLRELGYPVEAQRGTDGGYQLAAGAALPPLVIDDEEAVALAVGLQAAAENSVEGIAEVSVRVLAKVVQVMPLRLRRRVEALRAMTEAAGWDGQDRSGIDPAVLVTLALTCRDTEQLRFSYTAANGRPTDRQVEPHRLVRLGRRWYLVAYDLARHDWRTFRVDRLADPQGTGARFRTRDLPATDAAAFVRAGLNNVQRPYVVEVLADAPAATVRERIGRWTSVEEIDAEHSLLRMSTDSLDWPIMALGVLGTDFRVLGPPELLDRLQDWGTRFARAAEQGLAGPVGTAGTEPEGAAARG
ncbi:YafY family protein [Streptomyces sp. NPDC051976]|uniref:helix-turn-helix transcriptional regulator n=1 Tax=Streptomyces sp. NPDC051976 TaxID=3154947 RepID=UPI00343F02F4